MTYLQYECCNRTSIVVDSVNQGYGSAANYCSEDNIGVEPVASVVVCSVLLLWNQCCTEPIIEPIYSVCRGTSFVKMQKIAQWNDCL